MAKNKMAELAKMFGKKINEEFQVVDENNLILPDIFLYRFTDEGLEVCYKSKRKWEPSHILDLLLKGKYHIKEAPWKPGFGETYFLPKNICIYTDDRVDDRVDKDEWLDDEFDENVYNKGLVCRTEEQAIALSTLLIKTAREFQGFEEECEEECEEEE